MSDLIRRSDVLLLAKVGKLNKNIKSVVASINSLPSARPTGEWKRRVVDSGFNADWVCNKCGYKIMTDYVGYNFCPDCGAEMRATEGEGYEND